MNPHQQGSNLEPNQPQSSYYQYQGPTGYPPAQYAGNNYNQPMAGPPSNYWQYAPPPMQHPPFYPPPYNYNNQQPVNFYQYPGAQPAVNNNFYSNQRSNQYSGSSRGNERNNGHRYDESRRRRQRSRDRTRSRSRSRHRRDRSEEKSSRKRDRRSSSSDDSERRSKRRGDDDRHRSYSNRNYNRHRDSESYRQRDYRDSNKSSSQRVASFNSSAAYVQTTILPEYYVKDASVSKSVNASNKLVELCQQFEADVMTRSKKAREKLNLPAHEIPDYRKLLMTKKFENYSRCTCDKPHNASADQQQRHQHANDCKAKKAIKKDSESSSSDSEYSSESSSSDSSSDAQAESKTSEENKAKKAVTKANKKEDEEFDDIRSMEIHRKQNHPERLHSNLTFNEPDQTNEGPLCKCKLKNTTFGTRHQIYFGEEPIPACNPYSNNAHRLYHYRMSITPITSFMCKHPTRIDHDGHGYTFEGYSIFSHEPMEEDIPDCVVVIFNQEYKLNLVKEDMIENFTVKELELVKDYIFVEILELYDLKWRGYQLEDKADTVCNRFHVMPRFCRDLPNNGKEILSPSQIIRYFLDQNVPVIDEASVAQCHQMSAREWLRFVEPLQGSIVTCPGKRPCSIRLDQLDRDQIVSNKKNDPSSSNTVYPLIIHFSMFRNTWLPMIKHNLKLKKLYHKYFKLRHLLNNKSKLTTEDKTKLRVLSDELQSLMSKSSEETQNKETMIELSSESFMRTGMRTDLVQQTVLVPTFIEHLRFHFSLKYLEKKIEYKFKNRLLLQHALTHPSGAFLLHQNLGANPDHIRNCLFNCKDRNPQYGLLTPQKRKSMLRKKGIHMLFSIMAQKGMETEELSSIANYERLEFLGDKILELLVSKHLFFLFQMFDEGQLSEYRNAIVQNQYLAVLARKLDMHYFIVFYHGVDLCSNAALNHALANSFEALLAAIYLDSDLETVSRMLSKTLWFEETTSIEISKSSSDTSTPSDLYSIWCDIRPHPLQAQLPNGDRHLIPSVRILQHVNMFEDMIGVEFKHVRLLAQAFCTRSASFNLITLGDNQRLEFLGDTVLNFVVSDYLYRHFPNHHEGHLSLLRSSLVCNSTQALLYDELGMGDFVLTSYINNKPEASGNLKRKADVFEAFVGALYIDQGLEAVKVFCQVCMFNKLQDIIMYQFWHDPKSRLQQCCLSLRDVDDSKPSLPSYKLIEEKGPPNHKQYRVAVYFNRKRIGEGVGKSIHDAEVEAAKNALKNNANMFPILNKYIAGQGSKYGQHF